MPSRYICSSISHSLWIILIISSANSSSSNDYQHQTLKADVGQDVTMSCLFDDEKIEQVSFMRQMTGDILSLGSELFVQQSSSNQHIKLTQFASNRLDLKLLSVNENDSGIYTCMFNDEKLKSFALEIFVPPRFMSYYPIEGSVSYAENTTMNLSCRAFAVPPANITWIYRNRNKQSKTIQSGEDVYISSVRSSDSGSYECIASNQFHASISRSFYVTVQHSPRVTILNAPLTSDVHESVFVKCHVCSIPEVIQINWFRDDQIIVDVNVLVKTHAIDHHHCSESIMEIVDMDDYQFGRYECRAENNLGRNSAFVEIEQGSRNLQIKQQESHANEFNRNGRTALLIDNQSLSNRTHSILSTKSPRLSSNTVSVHRWTMWTTFLFSIFVSGIRLV